jgi:hypothetical protein
MDGVLIRPGGYHRALQDTVAWVGRALGYRQVSLLQEDIDLFEAVGVTSEWDSSAICMALLLLRAWEHFPDLALPSDLAGRYPEPHSLQPPDFQPFYRLLENSPNPDASPLQRAGLLLLGNGTDHSPEQARLIREILGEARAIQRSLTHRIFQELVLGSRVFADTYHLPPILGTEGYLSRYDLPLLSSGPQAALHAWLAEDGNRAAIFTNRPSLRPDSSTGTPEAEIGARVAGMEELPIVGFGALSWLAEQRGLENQAYLKPSPVHVLAATWMALQPIPPEIAPEKRVVEALNASLRAVAGVRDHGWQELSGARLCVFEDSVRGLRSALSARDVLAALGIPVQISLCGISDSPPKQHSLSNFGAAVFPTVGAALSSCGVI